MIVKMWNIEKKLFKTIVDVIFIFMSTGGEYFSIDTTDYNTKEWRIQFIHAK